MKTAKEYLDEAYSDIRGKQSSDHKDVDPPILMAMEDYAKQEAISFSEWLESQTRPFEDGPKRTLNFEELYDFYKEVIK